MGDKLDCAPPSDGRYSDNCVLCPIVVAARPVPSPEDVAAAPAMPRELLDTAVVVYRSVGCGLWGVALRCIGMPLEKLALYANSGQVSGAGQLRQAVRLTFAKGMLAPYRVIGPASILAWFLQYSSMSFVFQLADSALSLGCGVERVAYGDEVHGAAGSQAHDAGANPAAAAARSVGAGAMLKLGKDVATASIAGVVESAVSNRAEAQRYHGPQRFAELESRTAWTARTAVSRALGPAFVANASRNSVMAYSAFVATPIMYRDLVPTEHKSSGSLFFFGLSVNMFAGNAVAVTQQTLWGRALDRWAAGGAVSYTAVVREGLRAEGVGAFISPAKWFSRVMMNAPADEAVAAAPNCSSTARCATAARKKTFQWRTPNVRPLVPATPNFRERCSSYPTYAGCPHVPRSIHTPPTHSPRPPHPTHPAAQAEGTLAWFYNRVLPVGEPAFVRCVNDAYQRTRRSSKMIETPASRASR